MATRGKSSGRPARERILDTATSLFHSNGFHAVGVDRIVAEASVTKMTLYRYFRSKDALIAAFLKRANERFWEWFEAAVRPLSDPKGKLVAIFKAQAHLAASPQCLGCAFQMAAGEFPNLKSSPHRIALEHKQSVLKRMGELAREAHLRDPDGLARQLLILMDGAWAAVRVFGQPNPAGQVLEAAQALIAAHAGSDRSSAE